MHHFWSQVAQATHNATSHSKKVKNKKGAEADIQLPRQNFFPDGSDLSDDQFEDIIAAICEVLNMTAR